MLEVVPKLSSGRLMLEQISMKDAEGIFRFASCEQVAKTVTWDAHASILDSKRYIDSALSRLSDEKGKVFLCWAVKSRETDQMLGLVTLTELGEVRAQVGYVFHYDHWNRSEPIVALALVLTYSYLHYPHLHRIQARCFPSSTASRSLLESLGFHFEGVNRAIMKVRGELVDLTCYATTRLQWNQLNIGRESLREMAEHI